MAHGSYSLQGKMLSLKYRIAGSILIRLKLMNCVFLSIMVFTHGSWKGTWEMIGVKKP